jgi:hypothetical protein
MFRAPRLLGLVVLAAAIVALIACMEPALAAHGGGGGGGGMGGGGMGGGHSGGFGGGGMGMAMGGGHSGGFGGGMGSGIGGGASLRGPSFSGGNPGRSLSGLNFNGAQFSNGLGRSGPSGIQSPSNAAGNRGDWSRGSFNKNWDAGERFSHDGRFADFNRGKFNDFNHFHDFNRRGNFVITPFWWPFWWPAWWGGGYANGYYDYGSPYCYYYDANDYGPADVGVREIDNSVAATGAPAANAQPELADEQQVDQSGSSSAGGMFFTQAEGAFRAGKYHDALRLANHAAVESPRNPKAAELMSLALFADGDYRGAAAQAHAALTLGPVTTWSTLRGYYGDDVESYTTQLRALEKYSGEKPDAPEGHFLLAYQYLMTGYTKQAVKQFAEVVKLAPADKLSAELLKHYGGETPASAPPPPPKPMAF